MTGENFPPFPTASDGTPLDPNLFDCLRQQYATPQRPGQSEPNAVEAAFMNMRQALATPAPPAPEHPAVTEYRQRWKK
ncbi:MAG: hypothetical protein WCJ35_06540 [Planctomycetota bacterium]